MEITPNGFRVYPPNVKVHSITGINIFLSGDISPGRRNTFSYIAINVPL